MTISRDLDKEFDLKRSQWTPAEILVNRAKSTIRMALDDIETAYYPDNNNPTRLNKGPIGLQAHAGNQDVRHKDTFVEVTPKEDRLMTLKKLNAELAGSTCCRCQQFCQQKSAEGVNTGRSK